MDREKTGMLHQLAEQDHDRLSWLNTMKKHYVEEHTPNLYLYSVTLVMLAYHMIEFRK